MAEYEPGRLYLGVPGTGETTLYTARQKTRITSFHLSGDATGGTITIHCVPKGGTAGATNALAQAFAVGAAAVTDAVAVIAGAGAEVVLNPGDVLSALQSAGTHITACVSGEVESGN